MLVPAPATAVRKRRLLPRAATIAALGIGAAFAASSPARAAVDTTYTGGGVTIPVEGPANPYPTTITVGPDVAGTIVSARVTLSDFVHTWADDLSVMLQAPDGRSVVLMAGCRGGDDIDGTLTFADDGRALDETGQGAVITSGTYQPRACEARELAAPAPSCTCEDRLSTLTGGDPNGSWSLWIYDHEGDDAGSLSGWSLELITNAAPLAGDGAFTTRHEVAVRESLAPLGTDPDGDQLHFSVSMPPAHGSVFLNHNGTFTYVPDNGFAGTDTFGYAVDDGRVGDDGDVTITVFAAEVPVPPTPEPPAVRTCAGRRATIVGTPGPDVLVGTPGPDVIFGGAGRDSIRGSEGHDTICAGSGRDVVYAGSGRDTVVAGAGRDTVYGAGGDDVTVGGAGGDLLLGGGGRDTLRGSSGNDVLVGLAGDDLLLGGRNTDSCSGGSGSDRAAGCERIYGIP